MHQAAQLLTSQLEMLRLEDPDDHFFNFPFYPLSSCQDILASHFRANWLSQLGLGNQVGSTTDHLANCYVGLVYYLGT